MYDTIRIPTGKIGIGSSNANKSQNNFFDIARHVVYSDTTPIIIKHSVYKGL